MTNDDRVAAVLAQKGGKLHSVPLGATVFEALQLMADRDIGAVTVMSAGKLCGVFSERDYARKVILAGKASKGTRVEEIMNSAPIVVEPNVRISDCFQAMTKYRVRHLPVVENGRVVGIVSIGDLVNWMIESQDTEIEHLNHYIAGAYPS